MEAPDRIPHDGRRRETAVVEIARDFLRPSPVFLLGALIILLVTIPFTDELEHRDLVDAVLLTTVFLAAVPATGGSRRTVMVAVLLVAPAVIGTWLNHLRPDLVAKEITLGASIAFGCFVIYRLLRFIVKSRRVDTQVLAAGVSTYMMMAILWAFAYALVSRRVPHAFFIQGEAGHDGQLKGFETLYFSFVTLTTVGYGDIVPKANIARMLAMMEATTGTLFITVLIARLVAQYSGAGIGVGSTEPEGVPRQNV